MLNLCEHEKGYIDAFIDPNKKERYRLFMGNAKQRKKLLSRLAHTPDFDNTYMKYIVTVNQPEDYIFRLLKSKGAPDICYIISEYSDIDGQFMSLYTALQKIHQLGDFGSVLSSIPGKLACYKGESPHEYCLLER